MISMKLTGNGLVRIHQKYRAITSAKGKQDPMTAGPFTRILTINQASKPTPLTGRPTKLFGKLTARLSAPFFQRMHEANTRKHQCRSKSEHGQAVIRPMLPVLFVSSRDSSSVSNMTNVIHRMGSRTY